MANEHTQAFLDEVRSPKHLAAGQLEAAVAATLPTIQALRVQVAEWKALGQMSEMAEESPELRGNMGALHQQVAVADRVAADLERAIQELARLRRQMDAERVRLAPLLEALGYTA